jgi:hypothetical protein
LIATLEQVNQGAQDFVLSIVFVRLGFEKTTGVYMGSLKITNLETGTVEFDSENGFSESERVHIPSGKDGQFVRIPVIGNLNCGWNPYSKLEESKRQRAFESQVKLINQVCAELTERQKQGDALQAKLERRGN